MLSLLLNFLCAPVVATTKFIAPKQHTPEQLAFIADWTATNKAKIDCAWVNHPVRPGYRNFLPIPQVSPHSADK